MTNFPLLNQINEDLNSDSIDWNKNAFQTLLTSNLPTKTIIFYAIHVGFRRLESSLYEPYWDTTSEALNDLTEFIYRCSNEKDIEDYLIEAKCQLLMYASIAMIKMNTIRRRSTHDAKLTCALMCLLLLRQSKSFEQISMLNEYSTCIRSMRFRYLKRIFIVVQWLPTLSKSQFDEIELNYERYINLFLEQIFSENQHEQINNFIDNHLFDKNTNDDDDEMKSSGFVLIRRAPIFHEKLLDEYHEVMNLGMTNVLIQSRSTIQKLISCIWILACMIESDRVSLGIINSNIICEHFSKDIIDFEQKPIEIESLNERDVIVFLLLCALQNVHFNHTDSILHPYLLFSSAHLCTQQQKNWWTTAIEQTSSNEFVEHLATIRLDDERVHQYPPKAIMIEIARILFKSALTSYEQNVKQTAASYEYYAMQYFQTAKADKSVVKSNEKLFFFYSQKQFSDEEKTLDLCEKLARQCDELKSLPTPASPPLRTSSPTKIQPNQLTISALLSPVACQDPDISDSTFFATPPSNKTRDQTSSTTLPLPIVEITEYPLPSYVDLIFSHMNEVTQTMNQFCADSQTIQNDIHLIRERLDKINRLTSQMM